VNEVGPYAIGHGLGLTLHDSPFFNKMQEIAGVPPRSLRKDGPAVETYAGKRGGKHGVRLEEESLSRRAALKTESMAIEELMECWLPYK